MRRLVRSRSGAVRRLQWCGNGHARGDCDRNRHEPNGPAREFAVADDHARDNRHNRDEYRFVTRGNCGACLARG